MVSTIIMAVTEFTAIEQLLKFLSDNGVMIVISAVVIYFLIKVLNSMLDQNSKIISQITPQLEDIQKTMTDIIVRMNEIETRRSLSSNKQLSEVKESNKDVTNDLKSMGKKIEKLQTSIITLTEELEKQNMYNEILQNQINKNKGG